MTIYDKAPTEAAQVLRGVIDKYHPDLVEVEAKVGMFFATAEKNEGGEPIAPALALHGYPCYAKVKINSYRERVEGKPDATIYVDADAWEEMTEERKIALLDHECYHLQVKRDPETNVVQRDDHDRPKLAMRKHDFDVGWFHEIAQRHGDNSIEVRQAKGFIDRHGQSYFGWVTPPKCGDGETLTENSGSAVDGFHDDDARWAQKQAEKNGEPELVGACVCASERDPGLVRIDKAIAEGRKKRKRRK